MLKPLIPWPALLIRDPVKTLVIGDLHLGYEFALAEEGINIPSQTEKQIEKLSVLLDEVKPESLVFLGDFKHNIPKISPQEWRDIPLFLNEIKKKVSSIRIVPGNHDGNVSAFIQADVNVASSRGVLINGQIGVGLFHGHSWPSPKLFGAKFWVTAHNHPTIQFRGLFGFKVAKPVWLKVPLNCEKVAESFLKNRAVKLNEEPAKIMMTRYKTNISCSKLIIMPAFNELLGGFPFNTRASEEIFGPILRSKGVNIEDAEVFMVDGSYLGLLKDLRKIG